METAPTLVATVVLVLVLAFGIGPGFDMGFSGGGTPSQFERTYGEAYKPGPADGECVKLWNETSGTTGGQRALLATRASELMVHVERQRLALPGAAAREGSCGIVLADRSGNTIATFAWGFNGAAGYTDISTHAAARMYGRVRSASDVNAVMREDGSLVPVVPPSA